MEAIETSRTTYEDFITLSYDIKVGDFTVESGKINCQEGGVDDALELVVLDYKAMRGI